MYKKWEGIIRDGVDPFAREYVEKYIGGKIVFETDHWYIFENDHAYDNIQYQFVIVTQKLFKDIDELPDDTWIDLKNVKKQLCETYGVTGGGLTMRFGNTFLSGGSVVHLHAQFIVPKPGKKTAAWFGCNKTQ